MHFHAIRSLVIRRLTHTPAYTFNSACFFCVLFLSLLLGGKIAALYSLIKFCRNAYTDLQNPIKFQGHRSRSQDRLLGFFKFVSTIAHKPAALS